MELPAKVTEQGVKTVLVLIETAPGPRQNKADTLNWRETCVLFLKALLLLHLAE